MLNIRSIVKQQKNEVYGKRLAACQSGENRIPSARLTEVKFINKS